MELLVLCGAIEKDLICCFLATGMHRDPPWLNIITNLSDRFLRGPSVVLLNRSAEVALPYL